jgi:D-alanine-D-alanine ligase
MQGALSTAHIPFIGAGVGESAVALDKVYTKAIADSLGIPMAKWIYSEAKSPAEIIKLEKRVETELGFPVFIKPTTGGSSIGAGEADSEKDFIKAYSVAMAHGERVLIEKRIEVEREIECALLCVGGRQLFACGEVRTNGSAYGFKEKYTPSLSPTARPIEGDATEARLAIEYSRRLADLIGLRSVARIDFLLSRGGELYFNEINTMPGMTPTSLYPTLTEQMGLRRGEFLDLLIEEATK